MHCSVAKFVVDAEMCQMAYRMAEGPRWGDFDEPVRGVGPGGHYLGHPHHAVYSATKAGLHGLTRAIAVDHSAEGIRCNAVAPGWIDTELSEASIESFPDPAAFHANIARLHPVGRTGKPEDEAGFVAGQVFPIDGGRMVKLSLP